MSDAVGIIIFIAAWIVIQAWILPKMGVST